MGKFLIFHADHTMIDRLRSARARHQANSAHTSPSQHSRQQAITLLAAEPLEPRIVLAVDVNPVITVTTNFGSFEMELLWQEAPQNVDNFLDYVNNGDYNNSIFHRMVDISSANDAGNNGIDVLQGGAFTNTAADDFFTSVDQLAEISPNPSVQGEVGRSNVRGTVALALPGNPIPNPNGGTSSFFVNVHDNTQLNSSFTVFGLVDDLTLIDTLAEFDTNNVGAGLTDLPLSDDDRLIVIESITGDGLLVGKKYDDLDRDGEFDDNEPGIAGATIYLDANDNGEFDEGDEVATVTDEDGDYFFQVAPGTYIVRELPLENREMTQPEDGFYEVTVDIGRVISGLDFGSNNQTNQPQLDVTAGTTAEQLSAYEILASILDEDFVDVHEVEIDWGDGNVDRQVVTAANSSQGAAGDLQIRVDYSRDTQNFFNTPEKRDVMQAAADIIAAMFSDELTAITNGSGNTFDVTFANPANGDEETILSFSVEANEIVVFVGGRNLGSTGDGEVDVDLLGVGGPGGFAASGEQTFVNNARTRGQAGAGEEDDPQTDFGPWGGSIAFNSSTNWHFGLSSDGLEDDEFDFLSVALHELAHLLGVGSAGSWDALINSSLDLFEGPQVAAEIDNNADPAVTADGNHFVEGLLDEGREVALDPTLSAGVRKLLTNLDVAALGDIGWDTGQLTESGGNITASHIYTGTGVFNVSVRVTDSNGNVAEEVFAVTVSQADIGSGDPELLIVTTLSDVVAVDGQVSLREAILATNGDTTVGDAIAGPSTATIQFDPNLFHSPGTITLTGGELRITDDVSILGPGSGLLTIDADFNSRNFRVKDFTDAVIDVAISGLTIVNGKQPDAGGAIFNSENLTLEDVRLLDNDHGSLPGVTRGGAIYTVGNLTITNSTIAGNSAMLGGGIFVDAGALVEISNSTISGNDATRQGGGIYVSNGAVSLENTTISGNTAVLDGGGIYQDSVSIELTHVTIAFNEAASGGGIYSDFGSLAATNTIIARNSAGTAADAMSTLNGNNNLVQNTSGSTLNGSGNLTGVDPLLSALGDFGGPTQTHFLLGGSPAIDAGTADGAPLIDQRGAARPVDGDGVGVAAHDIGSVEVSTFAVNDSYALLQGESLDVNAADGVLGNDVLPEGGAEVVDEPLTGDLVLDADGSFTYLPPPDFFGQVFFTYTFGNGGVTSNTATVTITIAESLPPEIELSGSIGEEPESDTQEFAWTVTDPDNALFDVEVIVRQDGTIVHQAATGEGSFAFDDLGAGVFTIDVEARDVTNKAATASRSVTVVANPELALLAMVINEGPSAEEKAIGDKPAAAALIVETPEPIAYTAVENKDDFYQPQEFGYTEEVSCDQEWQKDCGLVEPICCEEVCCEVLIGCESDWQEKSTTACSAEQSVGCCQDICCDIPLPKIECDENALNNEHAGGGESQDGWVCEEIHPWNWLESKFGGGKFVDAIQSLSLCLEELICDSGWDKQPESDCYEQEPVCCIDVCCETSSKYDGCGEEQPWSCREIICCDIEVKKDDCQSPWDEGYVWPGAAKSVECCEVVVCCESDYNTKSADGCHEEAAEELADPQEPLHVQSLVSGESEIAARSLPFSAGSWVPEFTPPGTPAQTMLAGVFGHHVESPQAFLPESITGSGGDVEQQPNELQVESDETQDENVEPASAEESVEEAADDMSSFDRAFEDDLWLDFACGSILPGEVHWRGESACTEAIPSTPRAADLTAFEAGFETRGKTVLLAVPIEDRVSSRSAARLEPSTEHSDLQLPNERGSSSAVPLQAMAFSAGLIVRPRRTHRR